MKEIPQNVRIKDIAEKANVSTGTVDRVLHNRGNVSLKSKEKIEKAIKELGYKPNVIASYLASNKQFRFAFLLPQTDSNTNYWSLPLEGIQKAKYDLSHYKVEVDEYFFDLSDHSSFEVVAQKVLETKPDGVIIAPNFLKEAKEFVLKLEEINIPYLFIDSNIKESNSLSFVGQNAYQSGKVAAKLVDNIIENDQDILVFNISKDITKTNHLRFRQNGFTDYFNEKQHIGNVLALESNTLDDDFVNKKLDSILNSLTNVGAIFVTNSKVYKVANYLKAKEMNGIKLIGYDCVNQNVDLMNEGVIDFLISQKPVDQGYISLYLLYKALILKKDVDERISMPIEIITKENFQPNFEEGRGYSVVGLGL